MRVIQSTFTKTPPPIFFQTGGSSPGASVLHPPLGEDQGLVHSSVINMAITLILHVYRGRGSCLTGLAVPVLMLCTVTFVCPKSASEAANRCVYFNSKLLTDFALSVVIPTTDLAINIFSVPPIKPCPPKSKSVHVVSS